MLLNTMGKLIEKCVSNCIQFDCIKHGVFQSNQFGGIMQRSTKDAGLYLTHLVKAGWARGLKMSVIAFDIAQFFPSLNHGMLMAIFRRAGFPEKVIRFFSSYLVNRETLYHWGEFSSPKMNTDVGMGQGSALSPVESALYFAPVLAIFNQRVAHLDVTVLSYVDDGTLIVQSKSWESNLRVLREAYGIMFDLLTKFGLVLEHDKSELFHFSRKPGDENPSLENTLAASHPLRTLLGPGRSMAAEPHARSIYHMTAVMQTKVKSSLMEVNSKMLDMGEVFEPLCPELTLGK
jgi:hypothetical protein